MQTEITILLSGIGLGLSAGISPGPILTLAISYTLQHGLKEGIKIAIVPLITDLPIIAITLGLLSRYRRSIRYWASLLFWAVYF